MNVTVHDFSDVLACVKQAHGADWHLLMEISSVLLFFGLGVGVKKRVN